ncbi:MAG: ABC transporter ATP-binding protein [Deinococcota bacterium]
MTTHPSASSTHSTPFLEAQNVSVGYADRQVIENLSTSLERGKVTALVGPNGSGKSTLLKSLARLLPISSGVVYLDGKAIQKLPSQQVARELAILPQGPSAPRGLTVAELVEQGRFPHVGALRMLKHQDHEAVKTALELTNMTHYANRSLDALSGGERQRAWLALTLAQDTELLLLDEPTTFLDVGYQLEVLELVERLNKERHMTVVLVLHDLNQAASYSERMLVLQQGKIVADGSPHEVMTPELLLRVFKVHVNIVNDPATGQPVCLPYKVARSHTNSQHAQQQVG